MNAIEVFYWVDLLTVPTLVAGGVLLTAGLVGIVRSRRERVSS